MPPLHFALLLIVVIFAAAITIWLLTLASPGILVAALPALLIAAVAFEVLRR